MKYGTALAAIPGLPSSEFFGDYVRIRISQLGSPDCNAVLRRAK
jgi:hypothetical protein